MKSFTYAYAIAISHTNKKVNVFKMKKLEKIIMSNPKEMNQCQVANS
jgi:hypothetical protein